MWDSTWVIAAQNGTGRKKPCIRVIIGLYSQSTVSLQFAAFLFFCFMPGILTAGGMGSSTTPLKPSKEGGRSRLMQQLLQQSTYWKDVRTMDQLIWWRAHGQVLIVAAKWYWPVSAVWNMLICTPHQFSEISTINKILIPGVCEPAMPVITIPVVHLYKII